MRRVFVGCLVVLGLAAFSLPAGAGAVPTITVKAKIVPISGFPGTGNKLGAGAAVESQLTISGTTAPTSSAMTPTSCLPLSFRS